MKGMRRKVVIPVAVLALAAMMAYGAGQVRAGSENGYQLMVEFVAERFGLNADEVVEAMDDFREQRHEEMGFQIENRLNQAVLDGKISEEQRDMIIQKHEEIRAEREITQEAFRRMTSEERRDEIMTRHENLRVWAEENGIDLSYFGMDIDRGFGFRGMEMVR